jgi:hypothetical protein
MSNNTYSGRSILKALGVGEMQATLALGQMQIAPRSSDPDAAATVAIVKAVQRCMAQMGCPTPITGRLDAKTRACLSQVSGPNWEGIPWVQLTRDLVSKRDAGIRLLGADSRGGDYASVDGIPLFTQAGALLLLGGIAYLYFQSKGN